VIRPIQKPGILDFLIFSDTVESKRANQKYVSYERVIGRRRLPAILPIALIQDEPKNSLKFA
jgi:hypothetical protein